MLLTTLVKTGAALPRPGVFSESYGSFAFPSGHASGITLIMGLAASFVAQENRRHRRWGVYVLFTLPVLLVTTSRLYLGVHWLTDVIGGILLGLVVCGFTRVSFSRYNRRPVPLDPVMIVALLAGLGLIFGYVALSLPETLARYDA
jgi:undecaprenyl-diphosphatase